jgi:hypothetical protein
LGLSLPMLVLEYIIHHCQGLRELLKKIRTSEKIFAMVFSLC